MMVFIGLHRSRMGAWTGTLDELEALAQALGCTVIDFLQPIKEPSMRRTARS